MTNGKGQHYQVISIISVVIVAHLLSVMVFEEGNRVPCKARGREGTWKGWEVERRVGERCQPVGMQESGEVVVSPVW